MLTRLVALLVLAPSAIAEDCFQFTCTGTADDAVATPDCTALTSTLACKDTAGCVLDEGGDDKNGCLYSEKTCPAGKLCCSRRAIDDSDRFEVCHDDVTHCFTSKVVVSDNVYLDYGCDDGGDDANYDCREDPLATHTELGFLRTYSDGTPYPDSLRGSNFECAVSFMPCAVPFLCRAISLPAHWRLR
jgi:hypothetical protein